MEYQAIPLKWRPQNFDEVVGQDHITTTLKNAIKKKRVARAYLFAGPRGTGKTSVARILSKALNCKEGPAPTPCNKCVNCKEITASNSLDVLEIDGASNRGIDEIRNLRENIKLSPSSSRYKIYIIDEVHMLTEEAFNALLKTLEEPPEHVKFIFATTRPQKILPTILSRCQRFDFRRIPAKEIVKKLKEIVKKEKVKIDEDALFLIAKSADGSLRDAESILDQFSSYSNKEITEEDVNSVRGSVGQAFLFDIFDKIIQKNTKQTLNMLNEAINKGKDLSIFISELIEHVRDMIVAKQAKNLKDLIDASSDSIKIISKQAQSFSQQQLLYMFSLFSSVQQNIEKHPAPRIPIEMALVKLTIENSIVKVKELLDKMQDETETPNPGSQESSVRKEPDVSLPSSLKDNPQNRNKDNCQHAQKSQIQANINQEEFRSLWQKACSIIREQKTPVGLYISEGEPLHFENKMLTIGFYPGFNFHRENLEDKKNKKLVEKVFSELLKEKIRIEYTNLPSSFKGAEKKQNESVKAEAGQRENEEEAQQKKIKSNPIIDHALKIFDGSIIRKDSNTS